MPAHVFASARARCAAPPFHLPDFPQRAPSITSQPKLGHVTAARIQKEKIPEAREAAVSPMTSSTDSPPRAANVSFSWPDWKNSVRRLGSPRSLRDAAMNASPLGRLIRPARARRDAAAHRPLPEHEAEIENELSPVENSFRRDGAGRRVRNRSHNAPPARSSAATRVNSISGATPASTRHAVAASASSHPLTERKQRIRSARAEGSCLRQFLRRQRNAVLSAVLRQLSVVHMPVASKLTRSKHELTLRARNPKARLPALRHRAPLAPCVLCPQYCRAADQRRPPPFARLRSKTSVKSFRRFSIRDGLVPPKRRPHRNALQFFQILIR